MNSWILSAFLNGYRHFNYLPVRWCRENIHPLSMNYILSNYKLFFYFSVRGHVSKPILAKAFVFLRNLHTIFQSGYPVCIPTRVEESSPSPYPCQYLLFPVLLVLAILTSVRRYFTGVFICISLIITDKHLFTCPLAICMSLEKCLVMISAHFLIGLFGSSGLLFFGY